MKTPQVCRWLLRLNQLTRRKPYTDRAGLASVAELVRSAA